MRTAHVIVLACAAAAAAAWSLAGCHLFGAPAACNDDDNCPDRGVCVGGLCAGPPPVADDTSVGEAPEPNDPLTGGRAAAAGAPAASGDPDLVLTGALSDDDDLDAFDIHDVPAGAHLLIDVAPLDEGSGGPAALGVLLQRLAPSGDEWVRAAVAVHGERRATRAVLCPQAGTYRLFVGARSAVRALLPFADDTGAAGDDPDASGTRYRARITALAPQAPTVLRAGDDGTFTVDDDLAAGPLAFIAGTGGGVFALDARPKLAATKTVVAALVADRWREVDRPAALLGDGDDASLASAAGTLPALRLAGDGAFVVDNVLVAKAPQTFTLRAAAAADADADAGVLAAGQTLTIDGAAAANTALHIEAPALVHVRSVTSWNLLDMAEPRTLASGGEADVFVAHAVDALLHRESGGAAVSLGARAPLSAPLSPPRAGDRAPALHVGDARLITAGVHRLATTLTPADARLDLRLRIASPGDIARGAVVVDDAGPGAAETFDGFVRGPALVVVESAAGRGADDGVRVLGEIRELPLVVHAEAEPNDSADAAEDLQKIDDTELVIDARDDDRTPDAFHFRLTQTTALALRVDGTPDGGRSVSLRGDDGGSVATATAGGDGDGHDDDVNAVLPPGGYTLLLAGASRFGGPHGAYLLALRAVTLACAPQENTCQSGDVAHCAADGSARTVQSCSAPCHQAGGIAGCGDEVLELEPNQLPDGDNQVLALDGDARAVVVGTTRDAADPSDGFVLAVAAGAHVHVALTVEDAALAAGMLRVVDGGAVRLSDGDGAVDFDEDAGGAVTFTIARSDYAGRYALTIELTTP